MALRAELLAGLVSAESMRAEEALACFDFGPVDEIPAPCITRVPLARIQGAELERWSATGPVQRFQSHGYDCAQDDAHLFFRRIETESDDIERVAELAYRDLLALCESRGLTHLLRIWNYFDDVTVGAGDTERYRRFCLGRHRALAAPDFEHRLPAATVIGTSEPGLQLFGFASRRPGLQIENPRQTSAYRYPREYGPRSPSFSRATRYGDQLYVSGTAAIVGHQTRHDHQTLPQTDEMLDNLQALLTAAGPDVWRPRSLKLYLRQAEDAAAVTALVQSRLGLDAPLLVLQGDICRHELMVEIEGVFSV